MMTYGEILEYLYSSLPMYQRIGGAAYRDNLNNTLALDLAMGHPHAQFRSVHVAGTNGKGSVCHMLASVFQEAGYATGLYTSPHLLDFRERIRLNGQPLPEEEVVLFVNQYKPLFDEVKPSFFEMTSAMAFWYFARAGAEMAVVETGMGGRLDSTNIIVPLCSVITNIGLDHTQFLGDSLEKIAAEKAGIIKENIPVVIGETQAETIAVFKKMAAEKHSAIHFADQCFHITRLENGGKGLQHFHAREKQGERELDLFTDLQGHCQVKNLVTVLKTLDVLREQGIIVRRDHLGRGLQRVAASTGLQGRWQLMRESPLVIADVAHNAEGLKEVVAQLRTIPCRQLHLVFGMVNDKDPATVLSLLPENARCYFTRASVPRALDEKQLGEAAASLGLAGETFPTVEEAVKKALQSAAPDDLVFIGGSTFVVADFLGTWKDEG